MIASTVARFSRASSLLLAGSALPVQSADRRSRPRLPAFYDDIEKRTFRFFWETVNRTNGLVPDRWPTPSFRSIAAVGFAPPAYAIGVERGWFPRGRAARTARSTTLRFFWNAPQGPGRDRDIGHKGFFYHFLDMETGQRFEETSSCRARHDHPAGACCSPANIMTAPTPPSAKSGNLPQRLRPRRLELFPLGRRPPSRWAGTRDAASSRPTGTGYNEGMFVYILALGRPTHPARRTLGAVDGALPALLARTRGQRAVIASRLCSATNTATSWSISAASTTRRCARQGLRLFREQPPRDLRASAIMRSPTRCGWDGYSADFWGLTACDGPGDFSCRHRRRGREFFGYSARGP